MLLTRINRCVGKEGWNESLDDSEEQSAKTKHLGNLRVGLFVQYYIIAISL